MRRLPSGVENGRARTRRMGGLTSRIRLAWRRSRGGRSRIDFSVLIVLFVSPLVVEGCWRGCLSDKDGPAGDVQGGAADPRGVIGGQEQAGVGHVIRRAKTLDRMALA